MRRREKPTRRLRRREKTASERAREITGRIGFVKPPTLAFEGRRA
jgi:hypothetical protein